MFSFAPLFENLIGAYGSRWLVDKLNIPPEHHFAAGIVICTAVGYHKQLRRAAIETVTDIADAGAAVADAISDAKKERKPIEPEEWATAHHSTRHHPRIQQLLM
ncbi:hypothetical protein [Thioclava sp. GXIMD4216]|uniref:hypothetical protein n=1 Tax=Thioclava sp. GXIMD4216 TaxID=3131929 RepID=UPI0030D38B9F